MCSAWLCRNSTLEQWWQQHIVYSVETWSRCWRIIWFRRKTWPPQSTTQHLTASHETLQQCRLLSDITSMSVRTCGLMMLHSYANWSRRATRVPITTSYDNDPPESEHVYRTSTSDDATTSYSSSGCHEYNKVSRTGSETSPKGF